MANPEIESKSTEVLEKGNIYFVYRPKVEHETVSSADDIQRLHIVLEPHGKTWFRLMSMGKKHLPSLRGPDQQAWGFVEIVTDSSKKLEQELREEHYETKTRGDRLLPSVRPVAEGVYKIVGQDNQTRLLYALELPKELGNAQRELHISRSGNYIISVKNPEKSAPPGKGFQRPERKADLPDRLQAQFGDRRFIPAQPIELLDYAGTELLLVSTRSESSEDVGVHLDPQAETAETAETIHNLRMRKTRHPLEPLLEGFLI